MDNLSTFKLKLLKPYKITQVNKNGKRHYILPNGKKYPSVTTYLSTMSAGAIEKWRNEVGPEVASSISNRALNRGNLVHKAVEKYVQGKRDYLKEVTLNYQDMVKGVISFLDNRVDEVYGIELPLYSTKLRTAGTSDLFCRMDGVRTMADYKTAEQAKRESWIKNYFYQTTAYALMVYELYDIWIPQIAILIATETDGLQVFKKPTKDYIDAVIDYFTSHEFYPGS